MKLIFVRHGAPDYANDCLTPLGVEQAEAASLRLSKEPIKTIFSSPFGRAVQTAQPTAEKLGLPIAILDFMHEVSWAPIEETKTLDEDPQAYHPWFFTRRMTAQGIDLSHTDYSTLECWENSTLRQCYERIAKESDEWLESLGYRRKGFGYECIRDNEDTIALFAHHGSGTCLFSHLLNLPVLSLFVGSEYNYTGFTVFEFTGKKGAFMIPQLRCFNDHAHLTDTSTLLMQ